MTTPETAAITDYTGHCEDEVDVCMTFDWHSYSDFIKSLPGLCVH